jgi:hypothetical protein
LAENPPPVWTIGTGGEAASYIDLTLQPVEELMSSTRPIKPPERTPE